MCADLGVNPIEMADRLSAYSTTGEVVRLILAGWNLGKVTVRSVRQTWKYMGPGGTGVRIVDLTLQLKEYV